MGRPLFFATLKSVLWEGRFSNFSARPVRIGQAAQYRSYGGKSGEGTRSNPVRDLVWPAG